MDKSSHFLCQAIELHFRNLIKEYSLKVAIEGNHVQLISPNVVISFYESQERGDLPGDIECVLRFPNKRRGYSIYYIVDALGCTRSKFPNLEHLDYSERITKCLEWFLDVISRCCMSLFSGDQSWMDEYDRITGRVS